VRLTRTPAPLVFTLTALARIDDKRLLPWMGGRLKSTDQDVRWAAAVILNRLQAPCDDESRQSMINLVTRDQNNFVRAAAARALGRCEPDEEVRTAIGSALTDRDPKVRGEAAEAVGAWGDPELVEWLDPLARLKARSARWTRGRRPQRPSRPCVQPSKFPTSSHPSYSRSREPRGAS
jgi:hypothetical protein